MDYLLMIYWFIQNQGFEGSAALGSDVTNQLCKKRVQKLHVGADNWDNDLGEEKSRGPT